MGMIINPYRFAVANTTPACISDGNTVGWYIASETGDITKDGSNLVSQWNDHLGGGNDLTSSSTCKPVWSSDGITFDGSNDYMEKSFTFNQPDTIYAVLKQISWTDNDVIISNKNSGWGHTLIQKSTSPGIVFYGGSEDSSQDNNLSIGSVGIVRIIANGANSKLQINNNTAITGNFGTTAPAGICIGGRNDSYNANVLFKELIFRKVSDNATDYEAIYNYLATKYSIT